MERSVAESPPAAEAALRNLWYVPDRRLRTESAGERAKMVAEWSGGARNEVDEPDEHDLFVALHTCAYRVSRRSNGHRITPAERSRWAGRWREIRDYLVEKNLGLVYAMLGKFRSGELDEDDLLSEGMLGLTRAVDRFNPWKGYRFSTYACNVILRALMQRGKRESNYRRRFPVHFDTALEEQSEVASDRTEWYVDRLSRALEKNLAGLSGLESQIIAQRFPGGRSPRLTFQQIGHEVGLSKERVRQIQNIALGKLRGVLEADFALQ